jgi:dienelactone hydrolase
MSLPVPFRCRVTVLLALGSFVLAPAFGEPTSRFEYDHSASLDVRELSVETRGEAILRDVTFRGVDLPVKAYVVTPVDAVTAAKSKRPNAGLLYVHWLGEPATTNRTEFLNEALALAGQGVVSVLVDAMWSQPKWYENRTPEDDYANSVRQVIELRRAMDLLLAQPTVDPERIGFVGHDFGAMYGAVMGGVDQRARTYVLMAGTPHFIDWMLFARKPKDLPSYRTQLAPLDPVKFVSSLAPAPVFFQFAGTDEYVSATAAAEFFGAASPRKQMVTYKAGHDLHTAEVATDRIAWLMRELAPGR